MQITLNRVPHNILIIAQHRNLTTRQQSQEIIWQGCNEYMEALETASFHLNIEPFTEFLSKVVTDSLAGMPLAKRL